MTNPPKRAKKIQVSVKFSKILQGIPGRLAGPHLRAEVCVGPDLQRRIGHEMITTVAGTAAVAE